MSAGSDPPQQFELLSSCPEGDVIVAAHSAMFSELPNFDVDLLLDELRELHDYRMLQCREQLRVRTRVSGTMLHHLSEDEHLFLMRVLVGKLVERISQHGVLGIHEREESVDLR